MERAREARHTGVVALAAGAGVVLGAVVAGAAVVRRSKPLHPVGEVVEARLELAGGAPELGPVLGAVGSHPAVVRLSRGGGLPSGWPDVHGLAVRWPGPDRPNDLLLSSAGLGRWARFVPVPRRDRWAGAFTTLMPFRGPGGPVLLAAVPRTDDRVLTLARAGLTGRWRPVGLLRLAQDPAGRADAPVRFDPLLHRPPGLATYGWAHQLRTYAYRWARAAWPVGDLTAGPGDEAGCTPGQTRPGSNAAV